MVRPKMNSLGVLLILVTFVFFFFFPQLLNSAQLQTQYNALSPLPVHFDIVSYIDMQVANLSIKDANCICFSPWPQQEPKGESLSWEMGCKPNLLKILLPVIFFFFLTLSHYIHKNWCNPQKIFHLPNLLAFKHKRSLL